jgi:rhamnogalacturonan endolyase
MFYTESLSMKMRIRPAMMIVASAFALAAHSATDPRLAKPFIDHGHFGTPDWKSNHRPDLDGPFPAPATAYDNKKLRLEKFGRGVVAWRDSTNTVCVGWRYFSYDPTNQTFDVFKDGKKVNSKPIADVTQIRLPYKGKATYSVKAHLPTTRAIHGGDKWTVPADAPIGYIRIPLSAPPGGETPSEKYHMVPNDCSMGDLDGDGEMEIVIKWSPTNARDNSHPGHTGPTWFEGVKVSTGKSLWKINLGPNCRSGEHYNPFVVYDFDGDGCAEMIVRTSDGTVDGTGRVLGDPEKKWVEGHGAVVFAPQWYTVFDGKTGRAIDSITMKPDLGRDWRACRAWYWGDHGNLDGNRPFRFVASFGFLDGERPSAVMGRGYYSRTGVMALDFDGKRLKEKWTFDTLDDMEKWGRYCHQGFHSIRMGDVDFDGKDEVIYGQMVLDDDGTGLHSTGMGHGDALNLIQRTPYTRGLQIWTCQENSVDGAVLRDACTVRVIHQIKSGRDVPRAVAFDVDGCTPGVEMWSASGIGMHDGELNFRGWPPAGLSFYAYFAGDMTAASVAGNGMWALCSKTGKLWRLMNFENTYVINGSKCVPCLQADILGDWREEIVLPARGDKELRLFLSPCDTPYRFWTMLEDPPYRESVAAQNAGYNQPPQPGFYFGPDLLGHGIWWRGMYLPKWSK